MAFTPQFLDELRLRVGLADLVGKRVRLVRKGHEHSGLCPFHKEKTPSFTLNEEKGFYHCFGCGAHGSAIDFVMNMDGLSFPEAVERLAQEAGMEIPVDSPEQRERARRRQDLYDVMEAATAFFQRALRMPEGAGALAYLRDRGLDDSTLSAFRIGFAPDGRGMLKAALRRGDITDRQMIEAGLLIQPDEPGRDPFERFRGRVMFPIADRRGRVIAFGGRILAGGDKKLAKYLNSPETPLFHKGQVLYNMQKAARKTREQGTVIVTEGYMDVIALSRAGFENAVAPLGTALTEEQIAELWKTVREPVLCFDGDAAGARAQARAAERALPLLKSGHGLRFATLPPGEDPDSLIAARGRQAMAAVIEKAEPLSEVLWRMATGGRVPKTPEQRASVNKALEDYARQIDDPTVRSFFSRDFKDRLWALGGQGRGRGGGAAKTPVSAIGAGAVSAARVDAHALHERILIATLLGHPDLYDAVGERLGTVSFSAPGLDNLRQEVLKTLAGEPGLDSEGIRRHLKETGYADILDLVWGPSFFINAFFARPDTDVETALEGWEEIFALYRNADLGVEIKQESQRLIEDMSSENFSRFNMLSEQKLEASKGVEENRGRGAGGRSGKH